MRPLLLSRQLRTGLAARALSRRLAVGAVLVGLLGMAGRPVATAVVPATTAQPAQQDGGPSIRTTAGACLTSLVPPFQPSGYYETVWPSEHHDPWRTHAATGGPPASLDGAQLANASVALPVAPTLGYTRARDQVFVFGG